MKLEEKVTSLEISRKMKDLGVKQESLFYWHEAHGKEYVSYSDPKLCMCRLNISAFTASEIAESLPGEVSDGKYFYRLIIRKGFSGIYHISYEDYDLISPLFPFQVDMNLSSCMAKMLIHLIENKLIED